MECLPNQENVRGGCLHHSVDVLSRQRSPDELLSRSTLSGRVRQPHHGGHALFRLRLTGSQIRAANTDFRKAVANLITVAGADRVLTMDLHAGQIQAFSIFRWITCPAPVFIRTSRKLRKRRPDVVSPDVGGVVRARAFAKRLETDLAIIDKRRERAGVSEVMHIIGDVKDRTCVLVDDIVDSGGTLCNAAEALMNAGAKSVHAYITHGVLSGGAVSLVSSSPLESMVITDSILGTEAVRVAGNIKQISVAPLIGEAIERISDARSVSSLFD